MFVLGRLLPVTIVQPDRPLLNGFWGKTLLLKRVKKSYPLRQIKSYLIRGDSNNSRKIVMRNLVQSGKGTVSDYPSAWPSAVNLRLSILEFFNSIES